jgi:hypothetical protein
MSTSVKEEVRFVQVRQKWRGRLRFDILSWIAESLDW